MVKTVGGVCGRHSSGERWGGTGEKILARGCGVRKRADRTWALEFRGRARGVVVPWLRRGHLWARCQQRNLSGGGAGSGAGRAFWVHWTPGVRQAGVTWGWPFERQPLHPAAWLGPTGLLKAGAVTTILFLSVGRDSDVQGVSLEFLYSSLFAFCR